MELVDNKDTQRMKGVLDHCLLALIARRPRYGFELLQRLDELGLLPVGEGSIYPLLGRLQKMGLVETFIMTSDETGRKRKYYRILPKGEETLHEWNREWISFASRVNKILEVGFETEEEMEESREKDEDRTSAV